MRKDFILTLFLIFSIIFAVKANPVDQNAAKEIGAKFLNASVGMKATAGDLTLVKTYYMSNGDAALYVFSASNGYVIVSAQDVATPILGYSDEGPFDATDIPENMQWWLGDYAKQIQYGVEEKQVDFEKTAREWEMVKQTGRLSEERDPVVVVGPLLRDQDTNDTIYWNQGKYYNNLCPAAPSASFLGYHTYAGCVACSMSQIMRKWEWPVTGVGSHTSTGNPVITIDFSQTNYDWDNMPVTMRDFTDPLTSTQEIQVNAIATLMYHAGVAVNMRYSTGGSSAYSDAVPPALVNNFNYSDELYLEELNYTADDIKLWKIKLRSSIDHDYPMYYSGVCGVSGHAFVCDGYRNDNGNYTFHFNWGYDALRNGYFAIGALNFNPTGQYNANNDAIFNIHPNDGTVTNFNIGVSSNNDSYGTVTGTNNYDYGSIVTVEATPETGYCFCYWSEDGVNVSEEAHYEFTVKYNRSLVAVFSAPFDIATANDGHGTASGDGTFNYGDQCTLTATPSDGYVFVNWTKDGNTVATSNPYTFKVTGGGTYQANFAVLNGVAIGDGALTTTAYPTSIAYNNTVSEQIYTADEINKRGVIDGISFYKTSTIDKTRSIDIYMKATDKKSFTSTSDWVQMSAQDKVFSGSVTFKSENWTAITLDNSFFYDGASNLLIVVDDNTGTSSSATFKAYEGTEQTALVFRGYSNIDPINLSGNAAYIGEGSGKYKYKNQIILNIAADVVTTFNVDATVNDADRGSVSGVGSFIYGATCTLTATPESGYAFSSWTKDGKIVSTDATYAFAVKETLSLQANFYSASPISFTDDIVKTICVTNWDKDGDGEINYAEAASVTSLGTCFRDNETITSFDELQYFIGLTSLEDGAYTNHMGFWGCNKLTSIIIPSGVTYIGNYSFNNCKKLATVTINGPVVAIGNNAFVYCSQLTTIDFPNTLKTIGSSAFESCYNLTSLVIPDGVTSIGNKAFYSCYGLSSISVSGGNTVYDSRGECNAIISTVDNALIVGCNNTTIPDDVRSIGYGAFKSCSSYNSSVIPTSVTSIGDYAFNTCTGLKSIIIPTSVESIGSYAFSSCSSLNSITIDRVSPATLGSSVFPSNRNIYVPYGTVETYQGASGWSSYSSKISAIENSYLFSSAGNWADGNFTSAGGTDAPNTANAKVFIDANCTIPENHGNVSIGTLVVSAGKALTINSGNTLAVTKVDNAGDDSRLVIKDGAQLICENPVLATIQKSITAAATKDGEGWYTVSSPVNTASITGNTNLITGTYDLYRYNEDTHMWENYKYAANNNFDNVLENGRGYLYRNAADLTLSYAGSINTENVDYAVTNNGGTLAGFNLVGNPYSHNIYKGDGTALPNSKSEDYELSTGFYTLTNEGAWTAGTDNTTAIKPGQGFLVQAVTAGTLTFTNTDAKNVSKANNDNIMFAVSNNQYEDVVYASFERAHGLNKIDHRNANIPMLYIEQDGQNYAIATMSDDVQSFNLNFKAMTMGKYTLGFKAEGNYSYLHLIDKLTGKDVDLLIENEYSFMASSQDSDARFIVRLSYNDADNETFAYQNGNNVIVNGNGTLQVFDVTGRIVSTTIVNGMQTVNIKSQGVYILRLIGNNVKTQKIIVK